MKTSICLRLFQIFVLLVIGMVATAPVQATQQIYRVVSAGDDTRCVSGDCSYWQETSTTFSYASPDVFNFFSWPVRIPTNATITSAYLKLYASGTNSAPSAVNLDYVPPADYRGIQSTLPVGGSPVGWTISEAWSPGALYSSADISPLISSFIRGSAYTYGKYFILRAAYASGSVRNIYTWDYGDHSKAPILEVNYTGGEGMIEVWMAEPHVRTKQYIYVQLWNQDAGDIISVFLDDVQISTYVIQSGDVPANSATRFERAFLIDYTGLNAGNHHIDVSLKSSSGAIRASFTKNWTKLHSGYPTVGIDENNALCIKNPSGSCDLFFPFGSWFFDKENYYNCQGPPNLCLNFAAAVNVPMVESYGTGRYSIQSFTANLDAAAARHNSVLQNGTTFNKPAWRALGPPRNGCGSDGQCFNNNAGCGNGDGTGPATSSDQCSYVNYVKNHKGLLGWLWYDEPDLNGISPSTVRNNLMATHNNDTNHPVFLQYYGYDYSNGSKNPGYHFLRNSEIFGGAKTIMSDVGGMDYYPYEFAGHNPGGIYCSLEDYLNALDLDYAWDYGLIPKIYWVEPQDENDPQGLGQPACGRPIGNRPWTPAPTRAQIRNNVWLNVIHGGKGINWFGPNLFCPTLPEQISESIRAYNEISNLKDAILGPISRKLARNTRIVGDVTVNLEWASGAVTNNVGRVDYTVREYGGVTYIIAARVAKVQEGWPNGAIPTVSATFNLSGLPGTSTLNVYGENRTVTATDGIWSDNFSGFDVHIYYTGSPIKGGKPHPPSNLRIIQ